MAARWGRRKRRKRDGSGCTSASAGSQKQPGTFYPVIHSLETVINSLLSCHLFILIQIGSVHHVFLNTGIKVTGWQPPRAAIYVKTMVLNNFISSTEKLTSCSMELDRWGTADIKPNSLTHWSQKYTNPFFLSLSPHTLPFPCKNISMKRRPRGRKWKGRRPDRIVGWLHRPPSTPHHPTIRSSHDVRFQ